MTLAWWVRVFVHNLVAHPLLPAAEVLHALGERHVSEAVFWFHNITAPYDGAG